DERADEGAHDPAPVPVREPDGEVPDGQAHHDPGEHAHQRALPCFLFRGRRCLTRGGFLSSLSTRSSGARSAAASGSGSGSAVASDRVSTSLIDRLTIWENAARGIRGTFSLTRSNTMIVS